MVCHLIKEGGLGIRWIRSHTELLGKWLWRLEERDSMWRRVVMARYDFILDWKPKEVHKGFSFGF